MGILTKIGIQIAWYLVIDESVPAEINESKREIISM